jgi:alcohol dehydrogenase YqhD (iron-dependent ADH family)
LGLPFVAAQVLENLLKAYISRGGSDAAVRDPKIHHDLSALWGMAAGQGLAIASSPPDWVDVLSGLHNRPFYLRYSTGVNGIVSPNAQTMATGLSELMTKVKTHI